jgi:hypothetical protein
MYSFLERYIILVVGARRLRFSIGIDRHICLISTKSVTGRLARHIRARRGLPNIYVPCTKPLGDGCPSCTFWSQTKGRPNLCGVSAIYTFKRPTLSTLITLCSSHRIARSGCSLMVKRPLVPRDLDHSDIIRRTPPHV